MATYAFNAAQYRQASTHQTEWGTAIIDSLALAGHERVIDLGCGDGRLTAALAARVPAGWVLGIDSSPAMIAAAKQFAGPNLSFQQADINDLDFVEDFDVAFSNATLHWVADHRRMLARVRRALQPGGRLRFQFAGQHTGKPFDDAAHETMADPRFAAHFAGFTWPWTMPAVEDYAPLVRDTGFAEHTVWGENKDRYFPDPDAMIRWVDQPCLVPFLPVLPESDRPAFRAAVIERIVRRTQGPDGRCFVTFRRVNVQATK